jgi:hypothetical protein
MDGYQQQHDPPAVRKNFADAAQALMREDEQDHRESDHRSDECRYFQMSAGIVGVIARCIMARNIQERTDGRR